MNRKPGFVMGMSSVWKGRCRLFLCSLPALNRRATGHAAWLCSWWGLPFQPRCRCRGGLLPRHFTLTRPL